MNIEKSFRYEIESWKGQVNEFTSSNPANIGCKPYMNISNLGEDVLPLIRKFYNKLDISEEKRDKKLETIIYFGFPPLVKLIASSFENRGFDIPEYIRGKMDKVAEYTKNWLDDYLK
jgi:hypothetical protein